MEQMKYIPEGSVILSSEQDKYILDYINQTLSITSHMSNNEGAMLFSAPQWVQVSDNFTTSIGAEKAKAYGTDVFLLYYNNVPVLARLEGHSVLALEPGTMEARFAVVKNILEGIYRTAVAGKPQTEAPKVEELKKEEPKGETPVEKKPRKPRVKKTDTPAS